MTGPGEGAPAPPNGSEARRSERGRADAGAWAAAALVLALGGLGFGVVSVVRTDDLRSRVAELERERRATPTSSTLERLSAPTDELALSGTQPPPVPADPSRAEAEVIDAFETVYDGGRAGEERAAAIDDPRGVAAAFQAAAGGRFAALAATSRSIVSSVRFNSATEAVVTYRVESSGGVDLGERVGEARLTSGRWKVTRSTVCADLASVGAPCDG